MNKGKTIKLTERDCVRILQCSLRAEEQGKPEVAASFAEIALNRQADRETLARLHDALNVNGDFEQADRVRDLSK